MDETIFYRECRNCKVKKPLRDFPRRRSSSEARHNICRNCFVTDQPRRKRDARLRRQFDISLREYELLLVSQGGGCGICMRQPKEGERALAVDHCHKTGKIRGLLCAKCNVILGAIGDDLENVMRLVRYLRTHSERKVISQERRKIPSLCRRKDGRFYATDNVTGKPIYFGSAEPEAIQAYAEWVKRRETCADLLRSKKLRKAML